MIITVISEVGTIQGSVSGFPFREGGYKAILSPLSSSWQISDKLNQLSLLHVSQMSNFQLVQSPGWFIWDSTQKSVMLQSNSIVSQDFFQLNEYMGSLYDSLLIGGFDMTHIEKYFQNCSKGEIVYSVFPCSSFIEIMKFALQSLPILRGNALLNFSLFHNLSSHTHTLPL